LPSRCILAKPPRRSLLGCKPPIVDPMLHDSCNMLHGKCNIMQHNATWKTIRGAMIRKKSLYQFEKVANAMQHCNKSVFFGANDHRCR